jgi:Ca2+-binding RTX toxin-like protein
MATTVTWSSLVNGETYSDISLYDPVLNQDGVILHFDTPAYIDAYDLELLANEDLTVITVIDLITFKTVTFELNGLTVTQQNVTFAGGGLLLVGDDDYGTAGDNAGNHLVGGADWDQLVGLGGDDTLEGGAGNDVFTDQFGSNSIDGGAGDDFFYVFQDVGSSSTVTGGTGQDFYYLDYESPSLLAPPGGPGNDYLVTDFEAGAGGDVIYTSDLIYLVVGYVEDDPFAEGFLQFVPDEEDPTTLLYQGDRDGHDTVHGWMTLITLQGITEDQIHPDNLPDLVIGGEGDDTLTGSARGDLMASQLGNDVLEGKAGKDYLSGGGGSDVLDGGGGADTMLGGLGDDRYRVNHKDDEVIEISAAPDALVLPGGDGAGEAGSTGDTVEAAVNYAMANLVENLVLVGNASRGTGNSLANNIKGNSGNDTLSGAGGNDTLDGGADNDLLLGGSGDDRLNWTGNVSDRFNGGDGFDTLRATASVNLTQVSNTSVKSIEQIDLRASGNQRLTLIGSDVLDLSESTNTIKVLGNSGDSVDIVGAFTRHGLTGSGDFRIYKVGTGVLQIDTDMAVS